MTAATAPLPASRLLANLAEVANGEARVVGYRHATIRVTGTPLGWTVALLSATTCQVQAVVYVESVMGEVENGGWRVQAVRNGDLLPLGDFGRDDHALGEAIAHLIEL